MDPRISGSLGVNSTTQDKDVNAVPWSLVSSRRTENGGEEGIAHSVLADCRRIRLQFLLLFYDHSVVCQACC